MFVPALDYGYNIKQQHGMSNEDASVVNTKKTGKIRLGTAFGGCVF